MAERVFEEVTVIIQKARIDTWVLLLPIKRFTTTKPSTRNRHRKRRRILSISYVNNAATRRRVYRHGKIWTDPNYEPLPDMTAGSGLLKNPPIRPLSNRLQA
jgi:hypothetical protein